LHFALTFLWNAPTNPIKDVVRDDVTAYMLPFFEQNWSLFAPNPVNAEDEFLVRAQVADPQTGEVETTQWRSATELEWRLVRHNPAPSRASRLSSNLHRRLNTLWDRLGDEQQEIVARDYATTGAADWDRLAADLAAAQNGETTSRVEDFVRADQVAAGYATQFAKAMWPGDVTAVQFQLRRTPVPRWQDRMAPPPEAPEFSTREFGWRPPLVHDDQDESQFAATIDELAR
jgi:hypothetical protein